MPLILITGLPTSGKSTRAAQLYDYLTERIVAESSSSSASTSSKFRLHLISDQTLSISRSVYDLDPAHTPVHVRSANASEKDARAALYGAVKRVLSPRDIVILDTLNYIKGWRYQLYCEAKNVQTPFGLVQVGCPVARARGVNEARIRRQQQQSTQTESAKTTRTTATETIPTTAAAAGGAAPKSGDLHPETYQQSHQNWQSKQFESSSSSTDAGLDFEDVTLPPTDVQDPYLPRSNWENLVFRYEEPNPMTRWDSPLFILTWDDSPDDAKKIFDQIWDEVIVNKPQKLIRANKSTVQRDKDPGGDYLYVLERETQDIAKRILEQQSEVGEGGVVRLSRSGGPLTGKEGEEMLEVELPGKKVGLPQLQRYRRAFVALNRGGIGLEAVGTLAAGRLRESFVGYLNDAFEKEM